MNDVGEWWCPSRPGTQDKCELDWHEAVCRWCNRDMRREAEAGRSNEVDTARIARLERLLARVRLYRVVDERFERQDGLELDIADALAGRPERPASYQVVSWCCRCMQRTHRCVCPRR